jgi:hypothetical protein
MSKQRGKTSQSFGCLGGFIGGALLGLIAPFLYSIISCVVSGCSNMESPGTYLILSLYFAPFTIVIGAILGAIIGLWRNSH